MADTMHVKINNDSVSAWVKCTSKEVEACCIKPTQISREVGLNNEYVRNIGIDYYIEGKIVKIDHAHIWVDVEAIENDCERNLCVMKTVWKLRRSDFHFYIKPFVIFSI